MKIWILGESGLLGQSLIRLCKKNKIKIVTSTRACVDVTDADAVQNFADLHQPTHIINCTAYTNVDGAEQNVEEAFQINATGPENLGFTARENGTKLIHISTNFIFEGTKDIPYLEEDTPKPINTYGQSKWEGEQKLLDVFPKACIIRTSWLFGNGGKNFISNLLGAMRAKECIRVVEDQISSPTFSEDLAEAILSLMCHSGIFHFANQGAFSRYEIAQDLFNEAKAKGIEMACKEIVRARPDEFPVLAKRPAYAVLSTKKIAGVLGKPPRSWEEVLKEF